MITFLVSGTGWALEISYFENDPVSNEPLIMIESQGNSDYFVLAPEAENEIQCRGKKDFKGKSGQWSVRVRGAIVARFEISGE